MSRTKKSFLIVGLGRFGLSLCEKLVELGQSVIGVDQFAGPVAEMSEKLDVAAQLDVTDENALVKVGAKEVDVAVVTIGASLENSILCTSILVDLGIPTVVARANSPMHAKILARVGAHRIVFPEWDMGHKIAENFVYPWYSAFTKVNGGDFYFGKIKPLSEMVGKTMTELKFSHRYKVIVILLEYDGKQEAPSPVKPILETDSLWVLGHREDIDNLIKKTDQIGKL